MWKQNRSLFAYFRFMGYVMMIVGIVLIVNGIKDLSLIHILTRPGHPFLCTIEDSIESHRICFEAERSRRCGETIRLE